LGIIYKIAYFYTQMGIVMANLSNTIKQKRKSLSLTQEQLSLKSGLGLRLIREIEQGKTSMRMDKVNQLLALFGMELIAAPKQSTNE